MRILLLLLSTAAAYAQSALPIDLSGDWRVTTADRPEFAATDFDDTEWQVVTLPRGEYVPFTRGRWLRRRVELPAGETTPLAITLGAIQSVYEVFVNGQAIGRTSSLTSFEDAEISRPRTFLVPPNALSSSGRLQIAIHVVRNLSMHPRWRLPDRGPYVLTAANQTTADAGRHALDKHALENSPILVFVALYVTIAILSLLAWRIDLRRRELMWFAAASLIRAALSFYGYSLLAWDGHPFDRYGRTPAEMMTFSLFYPVFAEMVLAAMGYAQRWIRLGVWLTWSVVPLWLSLARTEFGFYFPNLVLTVVAMGTILWNWWRARGFKPSWEDHGFRLVLLLTTVHETDFWLGQLQRRPEWVPRQFLLGSFRVETSHMFWLVVSTAMLVLMARRLMAERREHQRLAGELEAARVIQQLLLREPDLRGAGFAVEAVYAPAQEVGGDFYQTFALEDGSTLIAVGDVSGKGLKAAMVVSLLTGALRNRKSAEPGTLLQELNLVVAGGLDGGFVTASVARCSSGGEITIANAGNPAPYLAGDEMDLAPGLPLGLDRDTTYLEHRLQFQAGQQLTFVSDGVVEASNTKGELFGFDRAREISRKPASDIAGAAKAWGQNDDITVVTVRRTG